MTSRLLYKRKNRKKSWYVLNQQDVNQVLFNVPLSVVIRDYVPLKKAGQDFVGRCPFCRELTKNNRHFRVSDRKKKYKCFECGFGGTVVSSFVMKWHDIPFDRAIQFINRNYYKKDLVIRTVRRIVVKKDKDNIDENLPF